MSDRQRCFQPAAERIAAKVIDGEAVIIDLLSGTYYSLSDSGGRVWELMESGCSVEQIAEELSREFGVSAARACDDVEALFRHLFDENLVVDATVRNAASDLPPRASGAQPYRPPVLQVFRDMQDLLALDPPMPGLRDIPWK